MTTRWLQIVTLFYGVSVKKNEKINEWGSQIIKASNGDVFIIFTLRGVVAYYERGLNELTVY